MGDIFFWGRRGSGKTAKAVLELLLDWYNGSEMWTNTPLHKAFDTNFKTKKTGNLKVVDAVDLVQLLIDDNLESDNTPKTLLLDEIKSQASAVSFGSMINKHLANFVSQARKRNFRILYCDQILNAYDKRIRLMTDKLVMCKPTLDYNDLGLGNKDYPEPVFFNYTEFNLDESDFEPQEPTQYSISRHTMRNIYPLYRTNKIITPIELKGDSQ